MSRAYECDVCGKAHTGRPALDVDVDTAARVVAGDIVLNDGSRVEWDWKTDRVEACPACAIVVLKSLNGIIHDRRP